MRDEIEIGGLQLSKKDWEATPASVRFLVTKLLARQPGIAGPTRAPLPDGVSQSGYGERLAAVVALLSGRHHQNHGLLQALLRDVFEVSISVGAMNGFYQELASAAAFTLGKNEKTPFAKTVRTCRQLLKVEAALWTFVAHQGTDLS